MRTTTTLQRGQADSLIRLKEKGSMDILGMAISCLMGIGWADICTAARYVRWFLWAYGDDPARGMADDEGR